MQLVLPKLQQWLYMRIGGTVHQYTSGCCIQRYAYPINVPLEKRPIVCTTCCAVIYKHVTNTLCWRRNPVSIDGAEDNQKTPTAPL